MLHLALWEPEIPPNTGNIARMCAAVGVRLHLIGRLGFALDDRNLKRAGCDYWPRVDVVLHDNLSAFESVIDVSQLWLVENPAPRTYTQAEYRDGDCLLFGNESRGLPDTLRQRYIDRMIDIPMLTDAVRSLNLATAAGIVLYEALRQLHGW